MKFPCQRGLFFPSLHLRVKLWLPASSKELAESTIYRISEIRYMIIGQRAIMSSPQLLIGLWYLR
jgi:hypothetical protein